MIPVWIGNIGRGTGAVRIVTLEKVYIWKSSYNQFNFKNLLNNEVRKKEFSHYFTVVMFEPPHKEK